MNAVCIAIFDNARRMKCLQWCCSNASSANSTVNGTANGTVNGAGNGTGNNAVNGPPKSRLLQRADGCGMQSWTMRCV